MSHLTNIFKLLFFVTLFTSVMTTQAVADLDNQNDVCPGEELTISNGSNIFPGHIENSGTEVDYYYITVPANGDINITWENTAPAANKTALFLVGSDCNGSNYYNGNEPLNYHEMNTTTFTQGQTIFIKIYDGQNNDYDLTINYQVDISNIGDYPTPSFCYDYHYQQNTIPLNETEAPPYIEDNVTAGINVDINLLIRNLGNITDNNSSYYVVAENAIVDIFDINATGQAIYSRDTTYLRRPGAFYRDYIQDSELTVSDAFIKGIEVGDVATQEFFAIDFSIVPEAELSFELRAKIEYDVAVPIGYTSVLVPQEIYLSQIPKCPSNDSGYAPAYSIFNVEHNALSSDEDPTYNLPTQTVKRVDDLIVASYKVDQLHTRNPVRTIVNIELIDGNKYGNIVNSCSEQDSAISPRITEFFIGANDTNVTEIPFNKTSIQTAIDSGYISDQILNPGGNHITSASEYYSVARENAAFRISYNTLNDGSLIQIEDGIQPGTYRISNFPTLVQDYPICKQPVKNPNNEEITTLTPVACSNAGLSSTPEDIAICMECIYGYTTRYLCSRDNFAIRPESFRASLSDQDQASPTTKNHIKTNIDNDQIHVVAGYQYALEVNATNYLNDNNTLGYDSQYIEENATEDKHFSFVWQNSAKDPFCNDISDHNKTMAFHNGALDQNISNDQIGEYKLEIVDKVWTRYDHDTDLLAHHSYHPIHGNVEDYFEDGIDCVENVTTVPEEIFEGDEGYDYFISGCDIKSEHTRYPDYAGPVNPTYTDINTRIHPYKFDLNSSDPDSIAFGDHVIPMVGPNTTRDQTFVYIDTPPTMDANDTNMSYNMNGTFVATGYDGNETSNFVTGCYAEDVNMTLDFIYNYGDIPPLTPYLSYSLKDYDTTNGKIRPVPSSNDDFEVGTHTSTTEPFVIEQNATYFSKDMEGAIRMNLGYNFVRTYNQPLNPRYIEFKDFNITYVTNPADIHADLTNNHQIFGDRILDQNVSFFYGRAKPSKFFYEDIITPSVDTPVSIVIYCGDDDVNVSKSMSFTQCRDRGVQTAFAQTNEINWWLSLDHDTNDADGNVVLQIGSITEGSGAPTVTPNVSILNDSAVDPNINVTSNSTTLPMTVEIDLAANTTPPLLTNRWLIYNEYYNSVPSPFYKVRFIGTSGWAGHGKTGHVVDSNTSIKKNRRLGW